MTRDLKGIMYTAINGRQVCMDSTILGEDASSARRLRKIPLHEVRCQQPQRLNAQFGKAMKSQPSGNA